MSILLNHPNFESFFKLANQGENFEIYRFFGAHPHSIEGLKAGLLPNEAWEITQSSENQGFSFLIWAPNASYVSVVGDFNDWQKDQDPLERVAFDNFHTGFWFSFVKGANQGQRYQFYLEDAQCRPLPLKADPLAFYATKAPQRESVLWGLPRFHWTDQSWLDHRTDRLNEPLSIYEVHLGSWRFGLQYDQLAEQLVDYVKSMGFNAIEIMPITEFPYDGSWGYQTLGLFAPTARYGTPESLMYLINACHQAGIAIILDWVPGHFPLDAHGLSRFDGTALYEHEDPRRGFHPDWQTALYQYERYEVQDFLISSAIYWLKHFHFDGLRVDAVASMLYLDYSRNAGEWIPNRHGGREHLEAIAFLKKLNEQAYLRNPGILMIAEESTAWPKVSFPTFEGGLGFGYKWNMGWMNDTLSYMRTPIYERKNRHHQLTFGLVYVYAEHFILAISHDEVVHGKGSLILKMAGHEQDRFKQLRLYYTWMWTHPGKKSLFMGQEFAQIREWSEMRSLDWHLIENPNELLYSEHLAVQNTIKKLNASYLKERALYEGDHLSSGFEWILVDDHDRSVLSFLRKSKHQDLSQNQEICLVILNFSDQSYQEKIGCPMGDYHLIFDSLDEDLNQQSYSAIPTHWQGHEAFIEFSLKAFQGLIFKRNQ
jgi:1,4-alpha-glucan branching enzyme